MERTLLYQIESEYVNLPIDRFLRSMGFSSQNITNLKKMPRNVLVNNEFAYMNQRLCQNDIVCVHILELDCSPNIVPVDLPLSVLYEDEDLMVINKAADMPIHPSINNYDNTMANAVSYYFSNQKIPFIFRCINRLDRDTTGLTIVAKHMVSATILSAMVSKHSIKREYIAFVEGKCPESGTIDRPIGRVSTSTIERCIDDLNGESATTHYRRLHYENNCSVILLCLETGRTHQIRVHMKSIGHPLLGDFLYNPNWNQIKRQALHSYRVSFEHPITKKSLSFTAPLPADMCFLNFSTNDII